MQIVWFFSLFQYFFFFFGFHCFIFSPQFNEQKYKTNKWFSLRAKAHGGQFNYNLITLYAYLAVLYFHFLFYYVCIVDWECVQTVLVVKKKKIFMPIGVPILIHFGVIIKTCHKNCITKKGQLVNEWYIVQYVCLCAKTVLMAIAVNGQWVRFSL